MTSDELDLAIEADGCEAHRNAVEHAIERMRGVADAPDVEHAPDHAGMGLDLAPRAMRPELEHSIAGGHPSAVTAIDPTSAGALDRDGAHHPDGPWVEDAADLNHLVSGSPHYDIETDLAGLRLLGLGIPPVAIQARAIAGEIDASDRHTRSIATGSELRVEGAVDRVLAFVAQNAERETRPGIGVDAIACLDREAWQRGRCGFGRAQGINRREARLETAGQLQLVAAGLNEI